MSAARGSAATRPAPAPASTPPSASAGRATPVAADAARPAAARFLLPALAGLALVAGYADLVRGGITLGPVLLVLAYCVLVPAAILRRR